MKLLLSVVAAVTATSAGAQIRSVTDPSAYRPDTTATERPAENPAPKPEHINPNDQPKVDPSDRIIPQAEIPEARAQGLALNLTCGGGGTANKLSISTVNGSSSASGLVGTDIVSMHGSNSGTITTQRQQGFADQVDVRLFTGDDRIRLPRTMLPPIHGGDSGWFKLKNVKATPRTITASAAVNFLNNPKIHIDRVTGTISISGRSGDYTGFCERVNADAPARF